LAGRDALLALLFRLETSRDTAQVLAVTDGMLAWFRAHPGFERLRKVVVDMLGAILAPLAPGVRVPEELLEVRNMLSTRVEVWKQHYAEIWKREHDQAWEQKLIEEVRGGEQRGEANLLIRLLERRFGALPGWARDRIAAADIPTLEEWGLRVLDASNLEDVLA
jgi:hypothetical protein